MVGGAVLLVLTGISLGAQVPPQRTVSAIPIAVERNGGAGANALWPQRETSRTVETEVERARNPLWAIPLRSLAATRERPLFSATRRPSAPAVAAAPLVPSVTPVATKVETSDPQLTLTGTIISGTESIGVFMDQGSKTIVRLRVGQGHAGWTLRGIAGRSATFERGRDTIVLRLPAPGERRALPRSPLSGGDSAQDASGPRLPTIAPQVNTPALQPPRGVVSDVPMPPGPAGSAPTVPLPGEAARSATVPLPARGMSGVEAQRPQVSVDRVPLPPEALRP
jgi:hypothetical protein